MPKKRKSGGRNKGEKGKSRTVQCAQCGKSVPIDKAVKRTRWISFVDRSLAKELREQGAIIPRNKITVYYCVSCAVHIGQVKVRSKESRKSKDRY